MNPKILGQNIARLRKHYKLTQVQLADKLIVSDKAVSKWEVGSGYPDMPQLEAITKLFNISYDELLKEEEITLPEDKKLVELSPKKVAVNYDEWYTLDNAAKVYPPSARAKWNMVFRVSVVLKEKVDVALLQQALDDSRHRFPTFMVSLKKGLFWYYFEPVTSSPIIQEDGKYPCKYMPLDGRNYLFRLVYSKHRIAVEIFHSVTDGSGAVIFFNSILARYYELKYGEIKNYINSKNVFDNPTELELDDSFKRYAENKNYAKRTIKEAYHVRGRILRPGISEITHVILKASQVNALAKSKGYTLTEYLSAVLLFSIYKRQVFTKETKLPICLQIPINLRKIFQSETLRNFSYFANVVLESSKQDYTVDDILPIVKQQMAEGLEKDYLQKNINANVKDETNPFIRIIPLFLKNIALNIASAFIGDKSTTMGFSNMGRISVPKELESLIDRFECIIKEPRTGSLTTTCVSFNDNLVITFSRSIKENCIEREFCQELSKSGLDVIVETNGYGG